MKKKNKLSILTLLGLILSLLLIILIGVIMYIVTNYQSIAKMNYSIAQTWQQIERQLGEHDKLITKGLVKNIDHFKNNHHVQHAQEEMNELEHTINQKGEDYNKLVKQFNQSLQRFPKNIIAGWAKIKKVELFNASTYKHQQ